MHTTDRDPLLLDEVIASATAKVLGMSDALQQQIVEWLTELRERRVPIPMLLWCPMCHTRHIDTGEFATRPHHTHACQNPDCGLVWRPSIETTVGVQHLPGFLNEKETP